MKNKNRILNAVMVLMVVGVVLAGTVFVSNLKSGKNLSGKVDEGDTFATVAETVGNVKIQRKGIGYTLQPGTILVADDVLTTLNKSKVVLDLNGSGTMTLNENANLTPVLNDGKKQYFLNEGEAFVETKRKEPILFCYENGVVCAKDSVFSLGVYAGVPSVRVLQGEAQVFSDAEAEPICVTEGNCLFTSSDKKLDIDSFTANSLSEFDLNCAVKAQSESLCFEKTNFQEVLDSRAQVKQQAILEKANADYLSLEKETAKPKKNTAKQPQPQSQEVQAPSVSDEVLQNEIKISNSENTDKKPQKPITSIEIEQNEVTIANSGAQNTQGQIPDESMPNVQLPEGQPQESAPSDKVMTAMISIDCSTILDNMENLKSGKEGYVPSDGMILYPMEVEFTEGDTVFDLLKRVCDAAGIQLEYSWYGVFGSNYIEGINHLYEFDCGEGSGWMYNVNGWYPDRGVSVYKLSDGDYIEFRYTCSLGTDVGRGV